METISKYESAPGEAGYNMIYGGKAYEKVLGGKNLDQLTYESTSICLKQMNPGEMVIFLFMMALVGGWKHRLSMFKHVGLS